MLPTTVCEFFTVSLKLLIISSQWTAQNTRKSNGANLGLMFCNISQFELDLNILLGYFSQKSGFPLEFYS